ncbi:unnamed protein product [Blepharisma stoltei]|uniref:Uncharacterized protein n=1 Tax=Blepharisma stoltei TaxID=1481888 RepID=A0AAU9JZY9_9CILI|nr:unnamed protein product [Blepharisma stoltei]
MVIIPKNYTNCDGESFSNDSELVFMVDSSGNNYNLPDLMKFLLKAQIPYTKPNGISNTFGGFFPSAIICDIALSSTEIPPKADYGWYSIQ